MTENQRSPLVRFFSGIWNFIDGTRRLVLNLLFLLIVFFIVLAFIDTEESLILQPQTALLLNPQGVIVEEFSGTPLDRAIVQATEQTQPETRLRDLVDAIRRARDDEHIVRLVINPSELYHVGMASLLELQAAIADFKTSGKPVIAMADGMGRQQYYLAAMADEIWLNPEGMVWLDGFSSYRNYYAEALDKLDVEVNLFRVGEYKSAMEPWIRNDMSAEDENASLFWLGSLWQQYLEGVSQMRGIPLVDLSSAINQFADRLDAAGGDFAKLALDLGLVDRLVTRPEANQELARLGAQARFGEGFRHVGFDRYLSLTGLQPDASSPNTIAVVVLEGEIVRGHQPPGLAGAETLISHLRNEAEKPEVKAVVVRMNSPGGEVFASELIRRELQTLREAGKTVVVSMGDVAASGAYWIAMASDEVWATPATITGSIGVFGMLPTFAGPMNKLGIHTDGVGTTPTAGKLRLDMPLDADLRRIFQRSTENTYEDFISLVAAARAMPVEEVNRVARGQVWSGVQARDRGLVDQQGGIQQAIDSAARIAGLGTDYRVQYSEAEMSSFEAFLLDMTGSAIGHIGARVGLPSGWAMQAPAWSRLPLLEDLLADLQFLANSGGEFTKAAHCLCRAP
jgi:protease-4